MKVPLRGIIEIKSSPCAIIDNMNPLIEFAGDARFGQVIKDNPKKVGFAFRNATNETVREIQKYARGHLDDNFTERNSFTKRGIVFDQARTPIIKNVEAAVGAAKNRPWMRDQEIGFESDNPQATEHMRVSGSYQRAVRKKNFIQNANIRRRMDVRSKAKTVRGKAMGMLAISHRAGFGAKGSQDFFRFSAGELFPSMEAGLYQFGGGSVIQNLGYPGIRLAYRLDNQRSVKATPWLTEAVEAEGSTRDIVRRFEKHLERQLRRGR